MICPCKIDDIKIPTYLKLLTLFTLWSKIDTVKTTLQVPIIIPISIHLVFSRFKVSLWSFSHFATANWHDLAHSAPGKTSYNRKSQCGLLSGTHSSISGCLADHCYKWQTARGLKHPMSYWQLVRHLIPTRCMLFSVIDVGTKPLKRICRQTVLRWLRQ